MHGIYLDHNATTPVLPDVLEAMLPFFDEAAGNPSSAHGAGVKARVAVERARDRLAHLVGAPPSNVLFTSSATEAINTAFYSEISTRRHSRSRIVITAVEHAAVKQCALAAEREGFELVEIPVDPSGQLTINQLDEAITSDTCMVSVMWANNETGVIFPISEIANLCERRDVPLHVDAVQALGRLPIDLGRLPIKYFSVSAHKLFGPKGVGALIASPRDILPFIRGGSQETDRRAGTENVPAIVGFGEAARLAHIELVHRATRVGLLRDRLEGVLFQNISGCYINGVGQPRIPNTTNLGFEGVDADALAGMLDAVGIYVSTGSACSADTPAPSHVVMAMTGSYERASEALRFSLSHLNTDFDIEQTIAAVEKAVMALRLTG